MNNEVNKVLIGEKANLSDVLRKINLILTEFVLLLMKIRLMEVFQMVIYEKKFYRVLI